MGVPDLRLQVEVHIRYQNSELTWNWRSIQLLWEDVSFRPISIFLIIVVNETQRHLHLTSDLFTQSHSILTAFPLTYIEWHYLIPNIYSFAWPSLPLSLCFYSYALHYLFISSFIFPSRPQCSTREQLSDNMNLFVVVVVVVVRIVAPLSFVSNLGCFRVLLDPTASTWKFK